MKNLVKTVSIFSAAAVALTMASCGSSDGELGTISVISREDGSGTRGAFIELFGTRSAFVEITGVEEKDADGNKTDKTTTEAMVCKSTDVMLTQVKGDLNSIGYVSYGSLNDTVKALKVDGVEVSPDTIKDGSYGIVRPFNIITGDGLSDAAQDFINYIMSSDGQTIIKDEKYVAVDESAEAYKASSASGKVTVAGSSSVGPVMQKLAEKYMTVNSNITVEVQVSDSTTGDKYTQDGTCDIGMISRELKSEETGLTPTMIAQDAIAVIVNKDNPIDDITSDQIKSIYTGKTTEWADITK